MFEQLKLSGSHNLPLILQAENAECGLACIAMISSYYGYHQDMSSMRRSCHIDGQGSSLVQMMRTAGSQNFSSRAIRCEPEELSQFKQPVILHWDFNHYVVLKPSRRNTIVILDPAIGRRKLSLAEIRRHFTGVVLEITPNNEFQSGDSRTHFGIRNFLQNVQGITPVLIQILILALILQLITLLSPFYTQLVIDEVLVKRDIDLLIILGFGFGCLTFISSVTQMIRGWAQIYLTNQISYQFGATLFQHLVQLPVRFFNSRHMGDIVSRYQSLHPIQNFITSSAVSVMLDGMMAVTTLAVVFVYSPLLACLVITTIGISLLLELVFFSPIKSRMHENLISEARTDSMFMETVRSISTFKRYGKEIERSGDWQNKFCDAINTNIAVDRLQLSLDVINSLIFSSSNIAMIYIGAQQVLQGKMSIGMLLAFIAYRNHLQSSLMSLVREFINYLMLSLHLERLADILLEPSEKNDQPVRPLTGSMQISDLSFRYHPKSNWIFRHLSISIQPGEQIAIFGPSGSGKSTLLSLMQSLQTFDDGEICFDQVSIRSIGLRSIQENCSSVMQDDQLLAGSIKSNIMFCEGPVDWHRIEQVAAATEIHNDITNLPMAYESPVGEMGGYLSAGQMQRVLIARALYQQPKILFLDEGTAHLDARLAVKVLGNIRALGITCIFVTHLKSQLKLADKILLLNPNLHPDLKSSHKVLKNRRVASPHCTS